MRRGIPREALRATGSALRADRSGPRLLLAGVLVAALVMPNTGCRRGPGGSAPLLLRSPDGFSLVVQRSPFALRLLDPDGEELTRIDPGGLGIGRVERWSPSTNYDPFFAVSDFLNGPHDPPGGFSWVEVVEVLDASGDGEVFSLDVLLADSTSATLRIWLPLDGVFGMRLELGPLADEVEGAPHAVFTYVDMHSPESEELYGLGEVFDSVGHRGRRLAMQMELSDLESLNNEGHVRIPLLLSSGSWGFFGDSMRPAYFDVAASDPALVRAVIGDPGPDMYLMGTPEPLQLTERYVAMTGRPAIPPVWAFAPIQWRNEVSGQQEVLEDASAIRDNQVPTGAIWIDRPYQTYYNSMDFDSTRYHDPAAMVADLHRRGFRLAAWNAPYLHPDDPDYAMAEAEGWFVEGTFVFTAFGRLLDLTNPDCMDFWQERVDAAKELGIEGWKLDYAEDIQLGVSDTRMEFSFASGEDERTMNRRYAEYYHRAYAEPLGLPEVFVLARAATIGGQRYASVIWPGDLDSDFSDFRHVDDDGTVHVGGLPAAVRAGTGLSVSGFPFFASDTGGFRHNRPTHEVMVRWTEYSALLPIMQYGGGGENHNPWDFTDHGASQFTPETLDIFIRYASLHTRLFPYFYTHALRAHETGRPVVRPLGLAYPEDGIRDDLTFLSGPDLLVAPVVESSTERAVPFPSGAWVDWWTGDVLHGPTTLTVPAPLDTLPLFVRAGGIVPMLRPTVVTLSPTSDPSVDSFDGNPGRVWGVVVPPEAVGESSLTLHDGTILAVSLSSDGAVLLQYDSGSVYAGIRICVHAPGVGEVLLDSASISEAVSDQELDGCDACWYREGAEPWVWLALDPTNTGTHAFTLR